MFCVAPYFVVKSQFIKHDLAYLFVDRLCFQAEI